MSKYTGERYGAHLAGVMHWIRQALRCTVGMLAAAWLHDVLEDVPAVTPESLDTLFGPQVASLVKELTKLRRTAEQRARLARVSAEAQTLKLADLLENAEGILTHDRALTPQFLQEVGGLLEVLDKGDPLLHQRLTEVWASGTP